MDILEKATVERLATMTTAGGYPIERRTDGPTVPMHAMGPLRLPGRHTHQTNTEDRTMPCNHDTHKDDMCDPFAKPEPTRLRWHMVPRDWEWSHMISVPEHDESHPWGCEWPEDNLAAIVHLSGWDYGEEAPETMVSGAIGSPAQGERVFDCAVVPGCGLYVLTGSLMGDLTLYRCEESAACIARHCQQPHAID